THRHRLFAKGVPPGTCVAPAGSTKRPGRRTVQCAPARALFSWSPHPISKCRYDVTEQFRRHDDALPGGRMHDPGLRHARVAGRAPGGTAWTLNPAAEAK